MSEAFIESVVLLVLAQKFNIDSTCSEKEIIQCSRATAQAVCLIWSKSRGLFFVTTEMHIHELTSMQIRTVPCILVVMNYFRFAVQHTSASLTINENYDSDVQADTETFLNRIVPEVSGLNFSLLF